MEHGAADEALTPAGQAGRERHQHRCWLATWTTTAPWTSSASGNRTDIWLADERHALRAVPANIATDVSQLIDLNDDGRLDLLGAAGRAQRLLGGGDKSYHWKQFRVRAQPVAGDQRINPFAVGGEIDVRAGLLRQRQLLTGTPAHFGLGTHTAVDVARIVWPNGAPQVEFASPADTTIVAEQRLKGSCPWVFAHDGTSDEFRHRLHLAVAARSSHQRPGHRRRQPDGRLGAPPRGSAGAAQWPIRGAHHRRALGNALLRPRLADGGGPSLRPGNDDRRAVHAAAGVVRRDHCA